MSASPKSGSSVVLAIIGSGTSGEIYVPSSVKLYHGSSTGGKSESISFFGGGR